MENQPAAVDCQTTYEAFWRLVFESYDGLDKCGNVSGVYAFAWLASLAFGAFVVVDMMVFLVRRFGFAATGAGTLTIERNGTWLSISLKTAGIILFGMIAAWIVAFAAVIVQFLQLAPQTAIAAGVLWQITYAQLLARFGDDLQGGAGGGPGSPPGPPPAPPVIQPATEEVAE